jgi:cysteine desulfurase
MATLLAVLKEGIADRHLGRVIEPGTPSQPLLPNILSFIVDGPPAEVFLHHLDARGLAASAGSACQSSKKSMNPALFAIDLDEDQARRVLRLSIGKGTSLEEVQRGLALLEEVRSELARHA